MLNKGILNPHINHLLARVRHTNTLLIADRGFTFYPELETIDISLVDGIPTVLQVLEAIKPTFDISQIYMAEEFLLENDQSVQDAFKKAFGKIPVTFEGYYTMKNRVPGAIGVIRTADTIQYANMLLVSGRVNE